ILDKDRQQALHRLGQVRRQAARPADEVLVQRHVHRAFRRRPVVSHGPAPSDMRIVCAFGRRVNATAPGAPGMKRSAIHENRPPEPLPMPPLPALPRAPPPWPPPATTPATPTPQPPVAPTARTGRISA